MPPAIEPPRLSHVLIDEITEMVFGQVVEPEPCDLIFIFGGSHPGLWEKGAEAYFEGLGKDIVAAGGYKASARRHSSWKDGTKPESHVIRRELIHLGVPVARIFVEERSTNTLENVRFAQEIYDFSTASSILAVCKSYGVGRQCRTLRRHMPAHMQIVPYPFDTQVAGKGPLMTRETWAKHKKSRAFIFSQVVKIYAYGRKGDLVPARCSTELKATIQRSLR